MNRRIRLLTVPSAWVLMTLLTGCASREVATVNIGYSVSPAKGLPPGMKQVAILPAQVTETTDPKWSDLATTILASLVNDSRSRFGTDITVAERRDTKGVFEEADLAAAGMSTRKGGSPGQLLDAEGYLLSRINVKIEKHVGKQRTLSGLDLAGFGGRGYGGGRVNAETEEVETVTRNMTVQTEFKLLDTGNGKVWEQFTPRTYSQTDKTSASPIFGSSQTEAELTPQDRIIYGLVDTGAREFISQLVPTQIEVQAYVESSSNKSCSEGVRMLRAEAWDDALSFFKVALNESSSDHAAAFGAGVACEASGRFDEALKFYNQACAGEDHPDYRNARDRVKTYGKRVIKG